MSKKIGDLCPKFSLYDQEGELINIEDRIGTKNCVIYFYPKDDTPGCTKEACIFQSNLHSFDDLNCEVFGISTDSIASHKEFANKYKLKFKLLSDPSKKVRNAFGVPGNLFGLIPGRVTYIIDKKGIIRGIYNSQTDPVGHINKSIQTLKTLD
jgi:peroxiredoxin Q/BCP